MKVKAIAFVEFKESVKFIEFNYTIKLSEILDHARRITKLVAPDAAIIEVVAKFVAAGIIITTIFTVASMGHKLVLLVVVTTATLIAIIVA